MSVSKASSIMRVVADQMAAVMRSTLAHMTKERQLATKQRQILEDLNTALATWLRGALRGKKQEPMMAEICRKACTQQKVDGILAVPDRGRTGVVRQDACSDADILAADADANGRHEADDSANSARTHCETAGVRQEPGRTACVAARGM